MPTRRQQIMTRYEELKEFQAHRSAELSAAENELRELERELKETPPDILDYDATQSKNEALRRAGLLPE